MQRLCLGLSALMLGLAATGCRHGNAINFVTNTQFGVKVGFNPEKIPEVQIGYNRQEATRVPVYWEQKEGANATVRSEPHITVLLKGAQLALAQKNDDQARQLIADANSEISKSKGTTVSPLFYLIAETGKKASYSENDRQHLANLINAEFALPAEIQQFTEQGKFIAEHGTNNIKDAYSVLGTFSGNGSGSASSSANGNVKVAQFFATGAAAQLLAQTGGAALVNPGAPPPSLFTEEQRKAAEKVGAEQHESLGRVAKFVFGAVGSTQEDINNRMLRAKKVLENVIKDETEKESFATTLSKADSEVAVQKKLVHYHDKADLMEANSKKL
jgi:hypothetical protein